MISRFARYIYGGLMLGILSFPQYSKAQHIPRFNLFLEKSGTVEKYENLQSGLTRRWSIEDGTAYKITFVEPGFSEEQENKGNKVDLLIDWRDGAPLPRSKGEYAKSLEGTFRNLSPDSRQCSLEDIICVRDEVRGHVALEPRTSRDVLASTGELVFLMEGDEPYSVSMGKNERNIEIENTEENDFDVFNVSNVNIIDKRRELDEVLSAYAGGIFHLGDGYQDFAFGDGLSTDAMESNGFGGEIGFYYRNMGLEVNGDLRIWKNNLSVEWDDVDKDEDVAYRGELGALFPIAEFLSLGFSADGAQYHNGSLVNTVREERTAKAGLGAVTDIASLAVEGGIFGLEHNAADFSNDTERYSVGILEGRVRGMVPVGRVMLELTGRYGTILDKDVSGDRSRVSLMMSGRKKWSPYVRLETGFTRLEGEGSVQYEMDELLHNYFFGSVGVRIRGE